MKDGRKFTYLLVVEGLLTPSTKSISSDIIYKRSYMEYNAVHVYMLFIAERKSEFNLRYILYHSNSFTWNYEMRIKNKNTPVSYSWHVLKMSFYSLFSDAVKYVSAFEGPYRVPWLLFDLKVATLIHALIIEFDGKNVKVRGWFNKVCH